MRVVGRVKGSGRGELRVACLFFGWLPPPPRKTGLIGSCRDPGVITIRLCGDHLWPGPNPAWVWGSGIAGLGLRFRELWLRI